MILLFLTDMAMSLGRIGMNLFKELVLGQRDKKRMGKWIRQRFFLIAGRLISGRKFILKLQEDWVYREEYYLAHRRLEGLAWVT
jgi:hypothetical protein